MEDDPLRFEELNILRFASRKTRDGFSIPNRTAFLTEKIYIKKVTAKSITDVDEFLIKEIKERCGTFGVPIHTLDYQGRFQVVDKTIKTGSERKNDRLYLTGK